MSILFADAVNILFFLDYYDGIRAELTHHLVTAFIFFMCIVSANRCFHHEMRSGTSMLSKITARITCPFVGRTLTCFSCCVQVQQTGVLNLSPFATFNLSQNSVSTECHLMPTCD